MNKKTKGAIAAGAAALLLAGGAGTFAVWSDTETVGGGTINAGKLSFDTAGSTPTWTDQDNDEIDLTNFFAVPGDTLTYKTSAVIDAVGDNLTATIGVDTASFTGDAELVAALGTPNVVMKVEGATINEITEDNDGDTVDVEVSFTFNSAAENVTQIQTATLSDLTLTLTQS